ncbi:MAG: uroporphyrinogen-III C-methyltransferase, partial [Chromatiaceae bacterium]
APGLAGDAGPGHLGEQIQTAQFALRRGDEPLFRLALDTAGAWIAAFYDPERPEVAAVQREIAALRQLPVRQDIDKPRALAARVRAVLGEMIQRAETVAG